MEGKPSAQLTSDEAKHKSTNKSDRYLLAKQPTPATNKLVHKKNPSNLNIGVGPWPAVNPNANNLMSPSEKTEGHTNIIQSRKPHTKATSQRPQLNKYKNGDNANRSQA
jgi:hypothetical protein